MPTRRDVDVPVRRRGYEKSLSNRVVDFAAGLGVRTDILTRIKGLIERGVEPVEMLINCPRCSMQHLCDPHEKVPHLAHACLGCKLTFRPANIGTVGVAELPAL